MRFKKKKLLVLMLAMLTLVLCGCGKVELASGKFDSDTTELVTILQSEDFAKLDEFTALELLDLSGSVCYDEIVQWQAAHPELEVKYTVALAEGMTVDSKSAELDLSTLDASELSEALPLLKYLPELESIKLGNASRLSSRDVLAIATAYPVLKLDCAFNLLGTTYSLGDTALDLSALEAKDVEELCGWMRCMPKLDSVMLGDDAQEGRLSWENIASLQAASPNANFDYSFVLYGKQHTLSDSELNLSHIKIDDQGALVKQVSACMKNLTYLDMDFCGVSNESMAEIRDSLPNANVVWRVWFGTGYTVRTDVEKILASNPGIGGQITSETSDGLFYCTKVKYLDLGHNDYLDDISFVSNMPDLEVAVLAMGIWKDASPLADCPKLEYLEIFSNAIADLSPLSGLKNLKHLNIGSLYSLTDISPLYELTQLERLWIGKFDPVPLEQIEKMQELAPNCIINTTTVNPTNEGWRYLGWNEFGVAILDPRYALLRQQFEYSRPDSYAYLRNDPLYY